MKYFVSYIFNHDGCSGPCFGNSEIILDKKIEGMQDLREIQKVIEKDDLKDVLILNYQEF